MPNLVGKRVIIQADNLPLFRTPRTGNALSFNGRLYVVRLDEPMMIGDVLEKEITVNQCYLKPARPNPASSGHAPSALR